MNTIHAVYTTAEHIDTKMSPTSVAESDTRTLVFAVPQGTPLLSTEVADIIQRLVDTHPGRLTHLLSLSFAPVPALNRNRTDFSDPVEDEQINQDQTQQLDAIRNRIGQWLDASDVNFAETIRTHVLHSVDAIYWISQIITSLIDTGVYPDLEITIIPEDDLQLTSLTLSRRSWAGTHTSVNLTLNQLPIDTSIGRNSFLDTAENLIEIIDTL